METINIQFQVPSTGQYTLDEFVAKLKDYAEKLASSISKSGNSYQEGDSVIIDLLTIYDKGEISNISDEFISFLLDKRKNG